MFKVGRISKNFRFVHSFLRPVPTYSSTIGDIIGQDSF